MSINQKILIPVAMSLFICLLCLITAGAFLIVRWHYPLGEVLSLSTITSTEPLPKQIPTTPEAFGTPTDSRMSTPTTPRLVTPEPAATLTPTVISPACGGPDLMYILAAGIDNTRQNYRYGRADVIRIIRLDFVTPRVTVLTLPRDLWVELPDIKEEFEKLTHGKLNTAYFYGAPALDRYDGMGGGPGLLAHTIAHNYGVYVDNYLVVDMFAFEQIVDAVGGIDIYLDQTWDGRGDREADHFAWVFEKGQHHLNGAEALRFARIRLGYGEITRTDNQTLVMCAIKDKVQQPKTLLALPEMVTALLSKVQTDLSPAQISQFICLLSRIDREDIQFVRFPDDRFVPGRVFDPGQNRETFVWDIPVDYIRAFMADFKEDALPLDAEGGGSVQCPENQ